MRSRIVRDQEGAGERMPPGEIAIVGRAMPDASARAPAARLQQPPPFVALTVLPTALFWGIISTWPSFGSRIHPSLVM